MYGKHTGVGAAALTRPPHHPPPAPSPLKGQGIPQLETDKVFVSAYLDRLLGGEGWQGSSGTRRPCVGEDGAAALRSSACLRAYVHSSPTAAVDEDMYRFEAVMYFYVSWTDKAAVATITSEPVVVCACGSGVMGTAATSAPLPAVTCEQHRPGPSPPPPLPLLSTCRPDTGHAVPPAHLRLQNVLLQRG